MLENIKVGMILENGIRQFTKVISIRNGIYGLSGWTAKNSAEKATVAIKFVNKYGLKYAGAKIVGGKAKSETTSDKGDSTDAEKPTKTSLSKLPAKEVKALAEKLGLDDEGTKPEILERLYSHFEL